MILFNVLCTVYCGRGCLSLESEGKEMRGCVSLESGIFVADDGTTGRETRGVLRGPRGPKNADFHQFLFHPGKIIRWLAAVTILRLPTFHIAHLKRYVHKFSGVPQKLTCCERFGLQLLPNSEDFIFVTPERPFLGVPFGQNQFSRRNGRLLPIACLIYSESYASQG